MKLTEQVNLDQMATLSWYTLPESARQYIIQRLTELAALPRDQWPQAEVKRLFQYADTRYLLRFPPGREPEGLRVVFGEGEEGQLTVLDMFLQAFLDLNFPKHAEPAPAA